jgi:hypothetical protein
VQALDASFPSRQQQLYGTPVEAPKVGDIASMSLDSLVYLLELYWPFLLAAAAIGLLTGWFTYKPAGR